MTDEVAAPTAEEDEKVEIITDSGRFNSWWRPLIGWVCAATLAYDFLVYPLMQWYVAWRHLEVVPPPLSTDSLISLVLGMLGLGAMRSFEKYKGIAR